MRGFCKFRNNCPEELYKTSFSETETHKSKYHSLEALQFRLYVQYDMKIVFWIMLIA